MKLAIWGTGKLAAKLLRQLEDTKRRTNIKIQGGGKYAWSYEIVYFLETNPLQTTYNGIQLLHGFELSWNDFDLLIIAVSKYEEILDYIDKNIKNFQKYKHKVINSAQFTFNMRTDSNTSPYNSCVVNHGLKFIFNTNDNVIGEDMLLTGSVYSERLINTFFDLVKCYYGDIRGNIFLDIGANIGTTSVYVKKIIAPYLRVIGLEPQKELYEIFRVNCILNEVEDIETMMLGISNNNGDRILRYIKDNPGGSYITDKIEKENDIENIAVMTLSKFVIEQNIDIKDIGYIWMDTEGHESEIIEGGLSVLTKRKIPLMQECSPFSYKSKEMLKSYIHNMQMLYSNFIDVGQYLKSNVLTVRKTIDLEQYIDIMMNNEIRQTDLFFF